jgi:hypothetical protein
MQQHSFEALKLHEKAQEQILRLTSTHNARSGRLQSNINNSNLLLALHTKAPSDGRQPWYEALELDILEAHECIL